MLFEDYVYITYSNGSCNYNYIVTRLNYPTIKLQFFGIFTSMFTINPGRVGGQDS